MGTVMGLKKNFSKTAFYSICSANEEMKRGEMTKERKDEGKMW